MTRAPADTTEPMIIGKHAWRIRRCNHRSGAVCIEYQFRRLNAPSIRWADAPEWPSYDSDDGAYSGLPRTLKKLYNRNLNWVAATVGHVVSPA